MRRSLWTRIVPRGVRNWTMWRRMWVAGTVVMLAMLQATCGGPKTGAQTQDTGRAAVPTGWKTQDDAMGFSVAVPPGWTARRDGETGRIEVSGPEGAVLVIWPVFLETAGLQPTGASAVAMRLTAGIWPNVMWRGAMPVGSNAVKLTGWRGELLVVSAFTWVSSARGTAGRFYAATAPGSRYAEASETFAKILSSFRARGTRNAEAARGNEPAVRYVKWLDPMENGFVLEVPEGWKTQGGTFRRAANDTTAGVVSASPDSQIEVQLGDPSLPAFTEPSQMLMATGFYEGSWYSPMPGAKSLVKRYLPAAYFLNEYVRTKYGPLCEELQVEQARDLPEAAQGVNARAAGLRAVGTFMQSTAGEISFTCKKGGQMYRGYYFAMTQLTRTAAMEGGTWEVSTQAGFLATAARADQARAITGHVLNSMQVNPQWVAMQHNLVANTSQIVSQTNAEISDMIFSGYERRSAGENEAARMRTNAIRGRLDVVDTNTGEAMKVSTGSNYYWMDQRGNIVGTETYGAPSVDFHELVKQP